MALKVTYEDREYTLDLDDMDMNQARAMERRGIPNLKTFEEGLMEGQVEALTFAYWLMLVQNGEPGARLDRVTFKPMKFAKAVLVAYMVAIKEAEAEAEKAAADPKDADDHEAPEASRSVTPVSAKPALRV